MVEFKDDDVIIASAVRTPIGKFLGGLSSLTAVELGMIVVKEAMTRAKLAPECVDEVIIGNVLSAGNGQNPARQCSLGAGIPAEVSAFTINKVCGSGLKAVMLAYQAIKAGDAGAVVCGGIESMSNSPHLMKDLREGQKFGDSKLIDSMVVDGLWDVTNDVHMGLTAEAVAEKYRITRELMDEAAADSQSKACKAIEDGRFKDEIIPIEIQGKKETITVSDDEGPRVGTTTEKLGKLRPAFKKEGMITPGNASTLNDGASALVVMSGKKAKELGIKAMAIIEGHSTAGNDPMMMAMAPEIAVNKLMKKLDMKIDDFDLIELNEAFAVQIPSLKEALGFDMGKVNVNGGAIALGHPIGASGARILTTLLYAMKHDGKKKGLATLCIGGGNAVALAVRM